jgi:3-dehydroquinate synthase
MSPSPSARPDRGGNIVITGFMGTGKSVVGREVARRLGREFVDMDEVIALRAGQSIPQIFASGGEGEFRRLEGELCQELAQRSDLVIATGGGALVSETNRARLEASGIVVCLECAVDELLRRLEGVRDRPLLQVKDRRAEVSRLLRRRRKAYDALPLHLDTTRLSVEEAADRVIELCRAGPDEAGPVTTRFTAAEFELPVESPSGTYTILLGSGVLRHLGAQLRSLGTGEPVAVVSNPTVWQLHGHAVRQSLRESQIEHLLALIPDGEEHKTLGTIANLYERFVADGLDRGGTVVAVGGGVVGDVAGFAAATYMRGVELVQVPTTLLSMVDSSVGGKTGVDLPQGKNLVGAFKQPALVVVDPDLLHTLPRSELLCGLAEVVKAGIIDAPDLFEHLEMVSATPAEQPKVSRSGVRAEGWRWPWVIRRALEVKIHVVQEDPLEQGRRAVLNLGHTVGHALERLSGYTLRHGEAVSIGLIAATRLAVAMHQADAALAGRVASLLSRLGLPTELPEYELPAIWEAMQSDKKRRGKRLRWVLPRGVGDVILRDDIPRGAVLAVLQEMQDEGTQRMTSGRE